MAVQLTEEFVKEYEALCMKYSRKMMPEMVVSEINGTRLYVVPVIIKK